MGFNTDIGMKNLCPDSLVPPDAAPAAFVAALPLSLALQGCLPTASQSRAHPDKSEPTNDFMTWEAKVWNDSRLRSSPGTTDMPETCM